MKSNPPIDIMMNQAQEVIFNKEAGIARKLFALLIWLFCSLLLIPFALINNPQSLSIIAYVGMKLCLGAPISPHLPIVIIAAGILLALKLWRHRK